MNNWRSREFYMEDSKLWERFEKRFHTRYDKTEDGCWEWKGNIQPNGYGRVSYKSVYYLAHRMMYFLTHGNLPDEIHHKCSNRACVNPAHLVNTNHHYNMKEQWYEGITSKT